MPYGAVVATVFTPLVLGVLFIAVSTLRSPRSVLTLDGRTPARTATVSPCRRASRSEALSPRMVRITLAGGELEGLLVEQPAASVRLLLPSPGTASS